MHALFNFITLCDSSGYLQAHFGMSSIKQSYTAYFTNDIDLIMALNHKASFTVCPDKKWMLK